LLDCSRLREGFDVNHHLYPPIRHYCHLLRPGLIACFARCHAIVPRREVFPAERAATPGLANPIGAHPHLHTGNVPEEKLEKAVAEASSIRAEVPGRQNAAAKAAAILVGAAVRTGRTPADTRRTLTTTLVAS